MNEKMENDQELFFFEQVPFIKPFSDLKKTECWCKFQVFDKILGNFENLKLQRAICGGSRQIWGKKINEKKDNLKL